MKTATLELEVMEDDKPSDRSIRRVHEHPSFADHGPLKPTLKKAGFTFSFRKSHEISPSKMDWILPGLIYTLLYIIVYYIILYHYHMKPSPK